EIRKSFVLIRTARILRAKPAGPAYVCRVRVDRPAEGVTAEERQAIRITLLNGELEGVVPRIAVATRHVEGSEARIRPTLLSVRGSGRDGDVHRKISVRVILEANPARANKACANQKGIREAALDGKAPFPGVGAFRVRIVHPAPKWSEDW